MSKFTALYKNDTKLLKSQECRRQQRILECKKKRNAAVMILRDIHIEDKEEKPGKRSNCKIMLAEELNEIPEDLMENWYILPVPKGYRNLLISNNNKTRAYSKYGKKIDNFDSILPGGSSLTITQKHTAIDTIYCKEINKYYVLDAICWNSLELCNNSTDMRFFWLKSKMEEMYNQFPNLPENDRRFIYLQRYRMSNWDCSEWKKNNSDTFLLNNMDGYLIYHEKTIYEPGLTPLVGWIPYEDIDILLNSV
ncbi:RNA U transporter 1 [Intoshia linei]|uniref:Snurportin-1 n=1 Tax=Intoshia linei TaxID=1819745 RepID=A0A177AUD3_9BILA|nr:RNA U transporter 1 [Intoshia linei]